MMTSRLKDCPFCGASAIRSVTLTQERMYDCFVRCVRCRAEIRHHYFASSRCSRPEAVAKMFITKKWNRRYSA